MVLMEISMGQCVKIKEGVYEENDHIGGRQGRCTQILNNDLIEISWDSITLLGLADNEIKQCEAQGLIWDKYHAMIQDLEMASERDSPEDVEKAYEYLSNQFYWSHLGTQGDRISNILNDVLQSSEASQIQRWYEYLKQKLMFSFEAQVIEHQLGPIQCDDIVTVLSLLSPVSQEGLQVEISFKNKGYLFPLSDLEVSNQQSPNHEPIQDYVIWHANR